MRSHRVRTINHHTTQHSLYSYQRLLMFSYLNGYTRDRGSKKCFFITNHSTAVLTPHRSALSAPQCFSPSQYPTESILVSYVTQSLLFVVQHVHLRIKCRVIHLFCCKIGSLKFCINMTEITERLLMQFSQDMIFYFNVFHS